MRSLPCFVYNDRVAMFEHRGVLADQEGVRANPLVRERSIGSYFTMKCDMTVQNTRERKYMVRDIKVIDHNRQTWKTLKFLDALKYSGLFDNTDAGNLTDWGRRVLFPNYNGDAFNFANLLGQYGNDVADYFRGSGRPGATNSTLRVGARTAAPDAGEGLQGSALATGIAGETLRKFGDDIEAKKLTNDLKDWLALGAGAASAKLQRVLDKHNLRERRDALRNAMKPGASEDVRGGSRAFVDPDAFANGELLVSLANIKNLISTGKRVPIQLYIMRPHQTFRMGALVAGRGGEETGFTVFGNANFELGDEATTKTAIGHYTCTLLWPTAIVFVHRFGV